MNLSSKELQEKIKSEEKFLVDLYADWCGPCKMMKPIIDKLSEEFIKENKEVKLYKFNIEEDKELALRLGVRSIPTLIGFNAGEKKVTKIGLLNEKQIIDLTKEVLT
jgi:thioredoxin 1